MTDPLVVARLDQARAELRETIARSRAALVAARARLTPTREELDRLQSDAAAGTLGRDMQRLAGHVREGETTWLSVFAGTSPYKELFREHLEVMGERYAGPVRQAIEADPAYDKRETSPGV